MQLVFVRFFIGQTLLISSIASFDETPKRPVFFFQECFNRLTLPLSFDEISMGKPFTWSANSGLFSSSVGVSNFDKFL